MATSDDVQERIVEDAPIARGKVSGGVKPPANPKIVENDDIPNSVKFSTEEDKKEVVEDKDITIKQSELDEILKRVSTLEQATSSSALEEVRNRNKGLKNPTAFLKVLTGKVVIGWKSEPAVLAYNPMNPNSVIGEVLKSKYYFLDGSDSGIIDQVLFTRTEDKVIVEILSDNGTHVKVRFIELVTSDIDLFGKFQLPKEILEIRKDYLNP